MFLKKLHFILAFILIAPIAFSQENNISLSNFKNNTSVVAPSPNAAAIAKYSEIPVNLHTGILEIKVPLFQWKEQEMEETLSLNYHAGGIKVEDVASNI